MLYNNWIYYIDIHLKIYSFEMNPRIQLLRKDRDSIITSHRLISKSNILIVDISCMSLVLIFDIRRIIKYLISLISRLNFTVYLC